MSRHNVRSFFQKHIRKIMIFFGTIILGSIGDLLTLLIWKLIFSVDIADAFAAVFFCNSYNFSLISHIEIEKTFTFFSLARYLNNALFTKAKSNCLSFFSSYNIDTDVGFHFKICFDSIAILLMFLCSNST